MALQVSIELGSGINVSGSYARIHTVGGTKETAHIAIRYYKDEAAATGGKDHLREDVYSFSPSVEDESENWIKQGYEHLKTLPEFEFAVDC